MRKDFNSCFEVCDNIERLYKVDEANVKANLKSARDSSNSLANDPTKMLTDLQQLHARALRKIPQELQSILNDPACNVEASSHALTDKPHMHRSVSAKHLQQLPDDEFPHYAKYIKALERYIAILACGRKAFYISIKPEVLESYKTALAKLRFSGVRNFVLQEVTLADECL